MAKSSGTLVIDRRDVADSKRDLASMMEISRGELGQTRIKNPRSPYQKQSKYFRGKNKQKVLGSGHEEDLNDC